MKKRAVLLLGALVALSAIAAHADDSTCAGATLVVPDGSLQENDLTGGGARWYRFVAKAGRSYAVMLENLTRGDAQGEIATGDIVSTCGGSPLPQSETADIAEPASTRGTTPDILGLAAGATRVALRVDADSELYFPVFRLGPLAPAHFRVRVEETTLFSPLWTTAGGAETHYRFYNTTNRHCDVTLDLRRDDDSVPAGGTPATTFTLDPNTSVSRQTGPGGLHLHAGQTGHATVAHTCPPGAILVDAFLSNHGNLLPLKFTAARQQR
jgi:hypothetical protein